MKYLSVCSGIEAATVAWHPLGWEPFAFSEIEPFPSKVLAHHYPQVQNFGDMTKFKEWPDAAIDVLVGGTPCQSFSVAGLRKGLDDPGGNLMLTYLAIADKYRPQWLVWENVPGVLSSNGGRDFASLLRGMAELGYGFAYRILDAQHFGVPQRRRRVFVVGCLGDWRRAAAVLFERHSMQGHPAPSRKAGEGFTHDAAPCLTSSGRGVGRTGETRGQDPVVATFAPEVARCVATREGSSQDWETTTMAAHSLRGEGFDASEDGTGRGTPLVPVSVSLRGREGGATAELGDEVGNCLRASGGGGDKAHVLAPVAFDCKASGQYGFGIGEIASTQRAMGSANSHNSGGGHQAVMIGMRVRRLTPTECERLQGFPDGYTDIYKSGNLHDLIHGKPTPDGPRYKALGNSMAVPVMNWIGMRINQVSAIKSMELVA